MRQINGHTFIHNTFSWESIDSLVHFGLFNSSFMPRL